MNYVILKEDWDYVSFSNWQTVIYGDKAEADNDALPTEKVVKYETVNVSIADIFDHWWRQWYCDLTGTSVYAVAEWLLKLDDYVNVPTFYVKKYF